MNRSGVQMIVAQGLIILSQHHRHQFAPGRLQRRICVDVDDLDRRIVLPRNWGQGLKQLVAQMAPLAAQDAQPSHCADSMATKLNAGPR